MEELDKNKAQEEIVGLTISDESWFSPLSRSMYEMAKNNQLCDTEIISAEGDVLCAHSTVLASRSEILKQTFLVSSCSKYKITTEEISSCSWKSLLEFIYLGTVDLEPSQLKDLSAAADILEMDMLKNNCRSAIDMQKEVGNINEKDIKVDQETCIEPEIMKFAAGLSETLEFVSTINEEQGETVVYEEKQEENKAVYYMVQEQNENESYMVQTEDNISPSTSANTQLITSEEVQTDTQDSSIIDNIQGTSLSQDESQSPPVKKVPAGVLPSGKRGRPKSKDPSKNTVFKCTICDKVYTSKQSLERHIHLHTNLTPYTCELCGKSFKTDRYLIAHIERHNEDRSFQCPICGKSFKTSRDANWHKKTVHNNSRAFQCQYCPYSTKTRALLNQHMFSHTSTKEWICKTCGKAFLRKQHLEQHASRHEGKRQYMCSTCGAEFYTIYACKEHHMRVHQGIKRYECSVCHQQYNEKKSFMKHLQKHSVDLVLKLDGGDIIIEQTVEEAVS